MHEAPGRHGLAIVSTAGDSLAGLPDTEDQQFLGLLPLEPPPQFLDDKAREGDGPSLFSLRGLEPQGRLSLLKALNHTH